MGKALETWTVRWYEEVVNLEQTDADVSLGFAPPELEGEMEGEGHDYAGLYSCDQYCGWDLQAE